MITWDEKAIRIEIDEESPRAWITQLIGPLAGRRHEHPVKAADGLWEAMVAHYRRGGVDEVRQLWDRWKRTQRGHGPAWPSHFITLDGEITSIYVLTNHDSGDESHDRLEAYEGFIEARLRMINDRIDAKK